MNRQVGRVGIGGGRRGRGASGVVEERLETLRVLGQNRISLVMDTATRVRLGTEGGQQLGDRGGGG
jgi:hypothetical protein